MANNVKTGVFICKCGEKIEPLIALTTVRNKITEYPNVEHCEIMSYPCLKPGLSKIAEAIDSKGINRIIIAGCEGRLMLKKFETELKASGLQKSQIDIVNIRGHVASVSDIDPESKAEKCVKLIKAAAGEMAALTPVKQNRKSIDAPVMVLGGGISSYPAALELASRGIDSVLADFDENPDSVIKSIRNKYPGDYKYDNRIKNMIREIKANHRIETLPLLEIVEIYGVTGDYKVSFFDPDKKMEEIRKASLIIACLDGEMENGYFGFGHDKKKVLTQNEFEEHILQTGMLKKKTVFWINDYEAGNPEFAHLSLLGAWKMARHIRENYEKSKAVILFDKNIEIPLSATERTISRKLGLIWLPYDNRVTPVFQEGNITYCNSESHIESEITCDYMVISPKRKRGDRASRIMKILNPGYKENSFDSFSAPKVRPEMIGRRESNIAGSAFLPCDLHNALTQGKKTGKKTAELIKKIEACELLTPEIFSSVNPEICVGCGLCEQLCECNAINVTETSGGGNPRIIDPLRCTGGGTCSASCPYNAITLNNNSTAQKEARASILAKQLTDNEVIAFSCAWGGTPAADNAGKKGIKYNPGVHIVGVTCVGQIDPSVLASSFANGAPGVILIGCDPGDCHHSYGIDHAWIRVNVVKKLLTMCGIDRRRIALAHADLNKPEEFATAVENFARTIESIGPVAKDPDTVKKLQCMYELLKKNSRIRHLISVNLRQPCEDNYRGDQITDSEYEREFNEALAEEFLRTRIISLLNSEKKFSK